MLLLCRDTDLGLLTFFFWVTKHQMEQGIILIWDHSYRSVGMLMSTGVIASVPYANENGVSLVGTRLVVL